MLNNINSNYLWWFFYSSRILPSRLFSIAAHFFSPTRQQSILSPPAIDMLNRGGLWFDLDDADGGEKKKTNKNILFLTCWSPLASSNHSISPIISHTVQNNQFSESRTRRQLSIDFSLYRSRRSSLSSHTRRENCLGGGRALVFTKIESIRRKQLKRVKECETTKIVTFKGLQ